MKDTKQFDRQEALEICYKHYRERNCDDELCHKICDHLTDKELARLADYIKREDKLIAEQYSHPRAKEILKQMETCSLQDLPNLVNELQRFLKYSSEEIQRILQDSD